MTAKIHFFVGKGGVGKSTTSALTEVHFACRGNDTLLVSMDPAHNQRDIFKMRFSEKPVEVMDHLHIREIDVDYWIKAYLKSTREQLKKYYGYHSAFNIQDYFNVLKYAPGLEEYAMLLAFDHTMKTLDGKDHVVFDMPPTALTLRFFSLPSISLIWLGELIKLRTDIYKKKEIVSKIRLGKKEIEQDKVKVKLSGMISDYNRLFGLLSSDSAYVNLVLNNDGLSFSESHRLKNKLSDIGITTKAVIINKIKKNESVETLTHTFGECRRLMFPLSKKELCGLDALTDYLSQNNVYPKLG